MLGSLDDVRFCLRDEVYSPCFVGIYAQWHLRIMSMSRKIFTAKHMNDIGQNSLMFMIVAIDLAAKRLSTKSCYEYDHDNIDVDPNCL